MMKYKQLIRQRAVCALMSVFLLSAGCEYDLGNNYVDLKDPVLDESKIDVSLNMGEYDGLFILEDNYFVGYNAQVPGYFVTRCIFRMGDKTWEGNKHEGSFRIYVNDFPNNIYDLTCEIYVKNTNGSVSGQAGHELYAGKKSWKLRVLARDLSDKPLPWRITDDGQFEVSWEIDESLRDTFEHYEIFFKSRIGSMNASYNYITYRFDNRKWQHPFNEQFDYESCEVFFYPKAVTARPFSLGIVDLRGLYPARTMSNPVNTEKK